MLTDLQRDILNGTERNAAKDASMLWPNNEIPYVIDSAAGFTSSELETIKGAIAAFSEKTCVSVVERTNQNDYVKIFNGGGCWSYWGRTGGQQLISLSRSGCVWRSTVVHEFLHALGFLHEQSRDDRDDYITINYDNVYDGYASQFNKASLDETKLISTYDYKSTMHYSAYAFSKNGQPTIARKDGSSGSFGQGVNGDFSELDTQKLNALYGCSTGTTDATTAGTTQATTTTTQATTTTASCGDLLSDLCAPLKAFGACEAFADDMKIACAETCEMCKTCENEQIDRYCDYWQRQGYCEHSYVRYMNKYCAKACGTC